MQLTLGEMIARLERCEQDAPVGFDFGGLVPTTFDSYRGYYDQIALGFADPNARASKKAGDLLSEARAMVGSVLTGWKGGDYRMHEGTPVWADRPGFASGTAISDVRQTSYYVVLLTEYID